MNKKEKIFTVADLQAAFYAGVEIGRGDMEFDEEENPIPKKTPNFRDWIYKTYMEKETTPKILNCDINEMRIDGQA
jgi:hypothetical protein